MSRLSEMIKKLCPNGVEYKKLGEIFDLRNGYTPSKTNENFWEGGNIPWFRMEDIRANGRILNDSIQHVSATAVKGELFPANSIIVATSATIGEHALITVPYLANQRFTALMLKKEFSDRLLPMFIYYYCFRLDEWCLNNTNVSSFSSVDMVRFRQFKFPLPPLEIQREIVQVLDNFANLTAELTAELAKRKKQYEHYRDMLLNFTGGGRYDKFGVESGEFRVEWKRLGEVIMSLNTGLNPRRFFRLNTDDATNYYVTIREMHGGRIEFSEKTDRINDEALRLCNNRSNLEVGDVLFSGTGTIGEMVVIDKTPRNWNIKEGVYAIKPNQSMIMPRYLRYILTSGGIRRSYLSKVAGGTVKSISMSDLKDIKIPLPPLEEQAAIVSLLDKFDSLCNSLTEGLPAEIALRKKQYEYYRDKLLSFKEAS